MKKWGVVIVGLVAILALALGSLIFKKEAGEEIKRMKVLLPYDLNNPDKELKLDKELKEISGLTYFSKGQLAGIQDEDGFVFIIDENTGDVLEKRKFNKDGDYEGIAKVRSRLFIVRHDGDLFEIKSIDSDKKSKKKENLLNKHNDVEGMCFDQNRNQLLIACKERNAIEDHVPGFRSVFAYDLRTEEILTEPFLLLDEAQIASTLGRSKEQFKPSGLAFHPITNELYIISGVNRALAVYDEDLKLRTAVELPKKHFKQPEGICFSEDGTLFISNEGRSKKGRITVFKEVQ